MHFYSILDPDIILLKEDVKTGDEAIDRMVDIIYEKYKFEFTKEEIKKRLREREDLERTIIDRGVWIPHARLEKFSDTIVSILTPKKPFNIDGRKINMVVMTLISPKSAGLYLHLLSTIAKVVSNDDIFSHILNLNNGEDLVEFVKEKNISVKKEVTVYDIMNKDFISVKEDWRLCEVLDVFFKENLVYAPVIDNEGNLIGEISVEDIVKYGLPDYVSSFSSLNFLPSLEAFEKLFENEDKIIVKEVMKKPEYILSSDASIIEGAFELSKVHCRPIPVVENNKVIGLLCCKDILKKVLRM